MRHQILCDTVTSKVFWTLTNHLDLQTSHGSVMQLAFDHAWHMICFALHVKKDVIPFSSDVGVTHVCGECDFCCDVLSFGFWSLSYTYMVYIHLVYIIICITQIVYSPHKPYCVMAWCQWTFLCLGDLLCKPNGVWVWLAPKDLLCVAPFPFGVE